MIILAILYMLIGGIMIGIKVIPAIIKKTPEMLPVIFRLDKLRSNVALPQQNVFNYEK